MDIYYIIFIIFFLIFLFTRIQIYFQTKNNIDVLYKEIEAYIYDISKLKDENLIYKNKIDQIYNLKDENHNFKKKIDQIILKNYNLKNTNTKLTNFNNLYKKMLPPG